MIVDFPYKKDSCLSDLPPVEETEMFTLSDGVVTISSRKGEELTLGKALMMIELVKQEILSLAKINKF